MNAAIVFLMFVACSSAAPAIPANSPDSDFGNQIAVGMLQYMFNSTGCVPQCFGKGACPTQTNPPTETNLRGCVDCILNCSPDTRCYLMRGYTQQQLGDGISGILAAIYLDGCRLAEASQDCPKPPNMDIFFNNQNHLPPAGTCPDPATLPTPPMVGDTKTKLCEHMKCAYAKESAAPACKRAAPGLGGMFQMMNAWIHC